LKYATRVNELRPDDPPLMDTLAAALAISGRLPEAVQLQRKAIALSKDAPIYRLHLAELLIQAGDRNAAKAELEALRRLGGRFDRQGEVTTLLARV
jgi:predicted Zn-dependent protease